jgi:hypothetical protein
MAEEFFGKKKALIFNVEGNELYLWKLDFFLFPYYTVAE